MTRRCQGPGCGRLFEGDVCPGCFTPYEHIEPDRYPRLHFRGHWRWRKAWDRCRSTWDRVDLAKRMGVGLTKLYAIAERYDWPRTPRGYSLRGRPNTARANASGLNAWNRGRVG